MFVDELEIYAKAGKGGDGVVRFRHEKHKPKGGPAGGNGGDGGNVYLRAVRNLSLLSKYTGSKEFCAQNGEVGRGNSQYGRDGSDLRIDVPVGARVTDLERGRVYILESEGEVQKILQGGRGGLGNEYFKSSTNRSPKQHTSGKGGEEGRFLIELLLLVDVGLIGAPNAGKSTLLNVLTSAKSKVGSYPFTTLEPHLGELHGLILADIPGLIEGASGGRGLGHRFLRHIERTRILLHCVSLEDRDVARNYTTIREELRKFDEALLQKEEWIVLTKSDMVSKEELNAAIHTIERCSPNIFFVSAETGEGIKELSDKITQKIPKNTVKDAEKEGSELKKH